MNSIELLKSIFERIDYPCHIEFVDTVWAISLDSSEILYNTDDDEDDLENQNGETYSVSLREGWVKHDGYLVANCDTGCGDTVTYFFNLSKEY